MTTGDSLQKTLKKVAKVADLNDEDVDAVALPDRKDAQVLDDHLKSFLALRFFETQGMPNYVKESVATLWNTYLAQLQRRVVLNKRYALTLLLRAFKQAPVTTLASNVLSLPISDMDDRMLSVLIESMSHCDVRLYVLRSLCSCTSADNVIAVIQAVEDDIGEIGPQLSSHSPSSNTEGSGDSDAEESDDSDSDDDDASTSSSPETIETVRKLTKKQKRSATPVHLKSSAHRNAIQQAILSLVQSTEANMTPAHHRTILKIIPGILSKLPKPKLLTDYITNCYNLGSSSAVLALTTLFTLITKHNVPHSRYYQMLYSITVPTTLMSPYRSRFIPLLVLSLNSTKMPNYIKAAFIRRLSRASLSTPVGVTKFILKYISNTLVKDEKLKALVHASKPVEDRWDPRSDDLVEAEGQNSMLWELDTLHRHWHPSVTSIADSIRLNKRKMEVGYDLSQDPSTGLKEAMAEIRDNKAEGPAKFGGKTAIEARSKSKKMKLLFDDSQYGIKFG